ncbi:MAG TPA: hypothetical protein VGJ59_17420 [Jatrophihabitantaceae bacterium]
MREGEDWHGAVTRTEYVTADVPWQESLLQDSWLSWAAVRSYPRGVTDTSWAKTPVVPGVPIRTGVLSTRDGDQLHIRLSGFTDADPTHFSDVPQWWFQGGTTTLSRNGDPIGPCLDFYVLNCDVTVPDGAATYTLAADDPAPVFTDAVQSSKTRWTFHSQPGEDVLPLIDLDYDMAVSRTDTVPAGAGATMQLGVTRQPGSSGGGLQAPTVQVSYDGGVTWQSARVTPHGPGRYDISYRVPDVAATNGFVALRASAGDAAGNSVVQEITRAYRLVG